MPERVEEGVAKANHFSPPFEAEKMPEQQPQKAVPTHANAYEAYLGALNTHGHCKASWMRAVKKFKAKTK